MAVTIRLRRIGRKKQPSYRVVVTDSARPRDGAYLEEVGFYNPRRQPAELRMDLEKVDQWVGRGAGMSGTVASLVRKARKGGDGSVALHVPATVAEVAVAPEPKNRTRARKAEPAAAPLEAPAEAVVATELPADAPSAEAAEPLPAVAAGGAEAMPAEAAEGAETAEVPRAEAAEGAEAAEVPRAEAGETPAV